MGSRTLLTAACFALAVAAVVAPAAAGDLYVDRAQATFRSTRKGLPAHDVRISAEIDSFPQLARFDPAETGLRVRVGEFTAVLHQPGADDTGFRLKKGVWRYRAKVDGVRTKVSLNTRSRRLDLSVKRGNASKLRDGGVGERVVSLELGSAYAGGTVVFDEQRRGSKVVWRALSRGGPYTPPGELPGGTPAPGGELLFTILARGNQSAYLQPEVAWARSDAELTAIWDRLKGDGSGPGPQPGVDYTQEMVLCIALGLVNNVQRQEVELVAVTDDGQQFHVSWRSHFLCGQYACPGGLQSTTCPDFSPYLVVRVRRVNRDPVSNRLAATYDDCP